MAVRDTVSRQVASYLQRVARLIQDLEQRRALCADLRRLVDQAERIGLVAAGERAMLSQLDVLLEEGRNALNDADAIATATEKPEEAADQANKAEASRSTDERIAAWQAALSDVRWDVAQQLRDGLAQKVDDQEER